MSLPLDIGNKPNSSPKNAEDFIWNVRLLKKYLKKKLPDLTFQAPENLAPIDRQGRQGQAGAWLGLPGLGNGQVGQAEAWLGVAGLGIFSLTDGSSLSLSLSMFIGWSSSRSVIEASNSIPLISFSVSILSESFSI
ncbi:hypothetical protein PPACK8108_LOCUS24465 [Phakopsora pachyrhizi]|uniref:Uncharacterized protein n=1 Tax=Phakopsora pachyrhizi TaxID=170000 RepID=A0AAV0BSI7_PHAPC|nr:hypothetical protein PPACK8108_LOCUS24465 [Phakopsora pachyrhizi]